MPNVQIPPGLSESGDVNHDQTQGGTEGNPHGDSAASADVSSIQSSSDVDHDNTSGGTAGNPHAGSASTNHGNGSHSSTFAVDGDPQPPENHGNAAHSSTFAVDGQTQPPENHGNAAHNTNFAADGDPQPPENHGNAAHNTNFAADGDPQPPENHGNGAHSANFAVDGNAQPPENHGNGAHTSNFKTATNISNSISKSGAGNVIRGEAFDTDSFNEGDGLVVRMDLTVSVTTGFADANQDNYRFEVRNSDGERIGKTEFAVAENNSGTFTIQSNGLAGSGTSGTVQLIGENDMACQYNFSGTVTVVG